MENLIFGIIIFFIIGITWYTNSKNAIKKEAKKLNELKLSFGQQIYPQKDAISKEVISGYFNDVLANKNQDVFIIDDITWNDLGMDLMYSVMNRTLTSAGEEILYSRLHTQYVDNKITDDIYNSMQFYIENEDVRLDVQKNLLHIGKNHKYSTYNLIKSLFEIDVESVVKDILIDVLVVLSFASIFISPGIGVLAFVAMLGVAIATYFKKKRVMEERVQAFFYLNKLVICAKELSKSGAIASELVDKLSNIVKGSFVISSSASGTSSNILSIAFDYIRMIFHIDLITFNIKLASINENKESIMKLYEAIGNVDMTIAVASFYKSLKVVCKAEYDERDNIFEANDLYHPLTKEPVGNDIVSLRSVLITGSNASGKSTFLKMVGIGVILAQSFGFMPASKAKISHYNLYTSMALTDNILGNESYYVVETKSLKRICDAIGRKEKVFCIVDEVLRGTNTIERIAASANILKFIAVNNAKCYVATHDVELTELLKDQYDLYFFAEEVVENDVIFPYKIRSGVSNAGNAIKLLKVMGYDEEIVTGANNLINSYVNSGKWVVD